MLKRSITAAILILMATAQTANASPAASGLPKSLNLPAKVAAMPAGKPTVAPFAHIMFCRSQPAHCRSGNGGVIELTGKTWSKIKSVNISVNRSIRPKYDDPKRDTWSIAPRAGDCEDFALTKRARLLRAGFKPSQLIMATAKVPGVGNHAVLVVRTNHGDFVLDNLTNAVKPWSATGYRWQKRQSASNPKRWTTL